LFFLITAVFNTIVLIPPDMIPMSPFAVIGATVFGAVGGTLMLAVWLAFSVTAS
jgi:hypothetical protein